MNNDDLQDAESGTFIIPAHGFKSLDFIGRFVRCFNSNGRLTISFNFGGKAYFDAGIKREIPQSAEHFSSFQLFNDNDYDVEVEVGWGFGDIDDSRLSVAGTVTVKNETNEELETTDAKVLAMLQNSVLQRAGLTDLTNADFASADATTVTLATAAQNIKGVIIRQFSGAISNTENYHGSLFLNGNPFGAVIGGMSGTETTLRSFENIFIPAGVLVQIVSNHGSYPANAWYEVL